MYVSDAKQGPMETEQADTLTHTRNSQYRTLCALPFEDIYVCVMPNRDQWEQGGQKHTLEICNTGHCVFCQLRT